MNALEAALARISEAAEGSDPWEVARIRAMLQGYHYRYGEEDPGDIVGLEQDFDLPIYRPDGSRHVMRQVGRFDQIRTHVIVDHKTVGQTIQSDFDLYWRKWPIDGQISMYWLAAHQMGFDIHSFLLDAIRKPTLKPSKFSVTLKSKKAQEQLEREGLYFGREGLWPTEDGRETLEHYEARVLASLLDKQDEYYQRMTVQRHAWQLVEWQQELCVLADEMAAASLQNSPKNTTACINYRCLCEYWPVCTGHASIEDEQYVDRPSTGIGGLDRISNSRISCWQSCRRKHYYRYVLGRELKSGEDEEALRIGRLVHEGLEAYYVHKIS